MPPARFGGYTLLGSVPFTLTLLYAGIVLGSHWRVVERYFAPLDWIMYGVIIAGAIYLGLLYLQARRTAEATASGVSSPSEPTTSRGPGDSPP